MLAGSTKGAAHREVCKVAHEGGGGTLEQELDHDLYKLCRNAGHGAEIEGADEDRDLAQVDLIEGRGKEKRDLDEHQHARKAGKDGSIGDVVGVGKGLALLDHIFFKQRRDDEERRHSGDTGQYESQIFHVCASNSDLKNKNTRRLIFGQRQNPRKKHAAIFFHPDSTVGTGITPVHAFRLADCTAGRELHPALKMG